MLQSILASAPRMMFLSIDWIDADNIDTRVSLLLENHNVSHLARESKGRRSVQFLLKAKPEILWYFRDLIPEAKRPLKR